MKMTQRQLNLILSGLRKKHDNKLEQIALDCGDNYIVGKIRENLQNVIDRTNDIWDDTIDSYEEIACWAIYGIHLSILNDQAKREIAKKESSNGNARRDNQGSKSTT